MKRNDLRLLVIFYLISTLIYYTASWISYGAFSGGHPSYLDPEEFLSAAGVQFAICFLLTLPVYYFIFTRRIGDSIQKQLAWHLLFLPPFVALSYLALRYVKSLFGWAMDWGGYATVWTVYFLLLFYMVQFGILHAHAYFKRFKEEEREKAILREAALQSEITSLKSQLNPHFLHNLFNSISSTIPPENERTRELIVGLSDLFRYQNYASRQSMVTVAEELEFIENYLHLMKIRLKDRLQYCLDISDELLSYPLPPMLLHPLVENAVIHGIAPKIEPSELLIRVQQNEDKVEISIEDTGIGIPDKSQLFKRGLGLANTKLRLENACDSYLVVEDNSPSGTKISFRL